MCSAWVKSFISERQLPDSFRHSIEAHYLPLGQWLLQQPRADGPLTVGINGAQGSGKSTLAAFLAAYLHHEHQMRTAVLSIDDFYLTRAERKQLAQSVHPLLRTRGVPGTHEIDMAVDLIDALKTLQANKRLALPRFDKATDDRAPLHTWPSVQGPLAIIFLEGWCVGSRPQDNAALQDPVNALEATEDADGHWRRHVNECLNDYQRLFKHIDTLIMLKAPDFHAVYEWRLQQEQQLSAHGAGPHIMDDQQLQRFIQHYQRITEANLVDIPPRADVVLNLDKHHNVIAWQFKEPLSGC